MDSLHNTISRDGKQRIGEHLVSTGGIDEKQLEHALAIQERTGERLGRILLAFGYVHRLDLYDGLASLWGMPFIRLADEPIDQDVARRLSLDEALDHNVVVARMNDDGSFLAAVTDPPDEDLEALLAERYGDEAQFEFMVTTDWDVDQAVRRIYEEAILVGSVYSVYYRNSEESAHTVFTRSQYITLAVLVAVTMVVLFFFPISTLIFLNLLVNAAFLASIGFKFMVSLAGARTEQFKPVSDEEVRALEDSELPSYTILVPVYKEANVVEGLVEHLAALEYPPEKLQVLLLIEEDDEETLQAAKAAGPPHNFEFIIIPDGQPKTKPKACNVGLYFTTGEMLVIYDAEDRPEADQLKKAVVAFRKGGDDLVCVQGQLNYYNWNQNFLTRMFTLEYSYWFDYMLPGLYRLGLPTPLGGTSNHFRTEALRELGGWDPFNVTEDADLGIRAAMHKHAIGVINSTTYEEANSQLGNWIRQRSRWVKGYMQTTLVHGRHPTRLLDRIGLRQALGFVMLVGGTPATFLCALILWTMFAIWAATGTDLFDPLFPASVLYISILNLLWGNALAIYLNMLSVFRRDKYELVLFALLNPIYWLLHSIASLKALGQLFTRPFFWEKTEHGLTRLSPTGSSQ